MPIHLIHRGLAKKNFKENTIKSFKYSFKKKRGIETDLHSTKDNELVCFHDFNLRRKFKLNKKIKDINYSDLKKISKKNKTEVPLLKDLIKISKNRFPLFLEIKPLFKKKTLMELIKIVKKIKKYGIISFKEKNLTNLYKMNKKLPLGLLFASTTTLKILQKNLKKNILSF